VSALPPGHQVLVSPDGRYAIVSRERMIAEVGPMSSVEDMLPAMARFLSSMAWLTEPQVRVQLAQFGLSDPAIDELLAQAVRKLAVMSSQPTVMERITSLGYRNADGQEVLRRTERQRDGQHVFVMRCAVCGHEYGAYGCDADIRRCPACQDGSPALPTN
jgi:hypothetical protein